jgi:hypothetical protein
MDLGQLPQFLCIYFVVLLDLLWGWLLVWHIDIALYLHHEKWIGLIGCLSAAVVGECVEVGLGGSHGLAEHVGHLGWRRGREGLVKWGRVAEGEVGHVGYAAGGGNEWLRELSEAVVVVGQRWVNAIETKIQLPNTLLIILNCVTGIVDWSNWDNKRQFSITKTKNVAINICIADHNL